MKVKVTKCLIESWWYNDRIGEIFDVKEWDDNGVYHYGPSWEVINPNIEKHEDTGILKEDCEEVTMEQAKEFKVGDEVKVVLIKESDNNDCKGFKETLGKIGEIRAISTITTPQYGVHFEDINDTFYYYEDELEHAEPVLTKAEVLKLCIDGAKVTNETNTDECYVYFGKHGFMFYDGITGKHSVASYALEGKQWKLWTPPTPPKPKFSIGQFVADYDGDYVRIKSMEYDKTDRDEGVWMYVVNYGVNENGSGDREESQLSEVKQ